MDELGEVGGKDLNTSSLPLKILKDWNVSDDAPLREEMRQVR